jgi:hypothetical protein
MAKASINFQTATTHTNNHMNRKSKVNYLIKHNLGVNQYRHYANENEALERAEKLTKEKTKRSMQKLAKENFVQEAVLNLNEHHNIEDVENVFNKLQEKYGGFEVFNIAVHKDEGVFVNSKYDISKLTYDSINQKWTNSEGVDLTNEVISVAPNRDIFYNKDDKTWYSSKDFQTPIDTNKLQKHMNYHAHITFTKFDFNKGKNVRLQKKDMQDIQTLVAETLGMERGEKGSNRNRLNHWQLKKQNDTLNARKVEQKAINTKLLATQTNLKNAIKAQRDKLKKIKAKREQYKELEQLNRDLKEQIKNRDLTILELQKKFDKLNEDKKLINERESKNKQNRHDDMLDELKITYEQTIEDLKLKNKKLNDKAKAEQLQIQNFVKKSIDLQNSEIKQEPKGFWFAVQTKIKSIKSKVKDLLTENKKLKKELINARETILVQKTTISSQKTEIELLEQSIELLEAKNKANFGMNCEIRAELINKQELLLAISENLSANMSPNTILDVIQAIDNNNNNNTEDLEVYDDNDVKSVTESKLNR